MTGWRRHPIDPHLAAERDRWLSLGRPLPGQWWTGGVRQDDADVARCVVRGLERLRAGGSPREAAGVAHAAAEADGLRVSQREAAELRVYHLCRLAGIDPAA